MLNITIAATITIFLVLLPNVFYFDDVRITLDFGVIELRTKISL